MNYEFELRFERKRNRTEARPVLIKDGHEILNPYDKSETDNKSSESGGVLDIAGFVCQIAAITLHKPALRPIMAMDEPFKNLSVEYRDGARQMIEMLSRDFGIQFLIVTHMEELMTGKVVVL
jgi:DNA repair exonuclease SbcCD ATPase subunit